MNKAELAKLGALVPPAPIKRTVSWQPPEGDEVSFEITVLPKTAGAMFRGREMAREGEVAEGSREAHAVYLATFLRLGVNGEEQFTYDEAYALEPSFFDVLMRAVVDTHGVPKERPKN